MKAGGRAVIKTIIAVLASTVLKSLACHVEHKCSRSANLLQS